MDNASNKEINPVQLEKTPEGYCLIGSSDKLPKGEDVVSLLSESGNFNGDPKNAAILIDSFFEGIKSVDERFNKKKLTVGPSKLVLFRSSKDLPDRAFFDGKYIGLDLNYLERRSKNDPDDIREEVDRETNEMSFVGTLKDYFKYLAREERHHSIFLQFKSSETYRRPEEILGPNRGQKYDAQLLEWRQLLNQIALSEDDGNTDLANVLRGRLESARPFRPNELSSSKNKGILKSLRRIFG